MHQTQHKPDNISNVRDVRGSNFCIAILHNISYHTLPLYYDFDVERKYNDEIDAAAGFSSTATLR